MVFVWFVIKYSPKSGEYLSPLSFLKHKGPSWKSCCLSENQEAQTDSWSENSTKCVFQESYIMKAFNINADSHW